MRSLSILASLLFFLSSCGPSPAGEQGGAEAEESTAEAPLTRVAAFEGAQVTGVTITPEKRLFACFPRWRDPLPYSVVEIDEAGNPTPYPNEAWNSWDGEATTEQFVCVQSVFAHGGSLWVLDPSNPMFQGVVGRAKLYQFDLSTDSLVRTYTFDSRAAPSGSYLNDLRIDNERQLAYITDSNLGAIVVLDLESGEARRLLDDHPSTDAEEVVLTIEGEQWLQNGNAPRVASDGIALNQEEDYLYYHSLTGYHLYRVPLEALADEEMPPARLGRQIEDLGRTAACDGMIFDDLGNLYYADLEKNAVDYRRPEGDQYTLIQGPRIEWADTFTIGPEGYLYFTTSRIHEASGDISDMVFSIFKTPLPSPKG